MNNTINSPKLKEGLKSIKALIICSVVCLLLTVVIGVWMFTIKTGNYESVTMNSAILSGNTEDTYASINANVTPYVFAEYDDTTDKYYLVMDENNLMYIVFLSVGDYYELDKDDIEQNPIMITGTTKKIPNDVKTLAIDAYNELTGEKILNTTNFEDYLGAIYLDTTSQPTDIELQIYLITITGVLTIVFLAIALVNKRKTNKRINSFTSNEWKLIEEELEKEETIHYKKLNLYLTENYIVSLANGIEIFSYNDILWMYPFVLKQYGITTSKSIIIRTKDKMKYKIATINNFSKKSKDDYSEIMNFIYNKNQKIAIGFSKENKQQMKDLYGIK